MKADQWRLLLLRCRFRAQPSISNSRCFSYSHFHPQVNARAPVSSSSSFQPRPHLPPPFAPLSQNLSFRCFSSPSSSTTELPVEKRTESDQIPLIADIFTKEDLNNDEIKKDLQSNNVVIKHDLVLGVLRSLNSQPHVALRFFNWVLEYEGQRLSSKSFNLMLGILGVNELVTEFWDLLEITKKKGYGVHNGTLARLSENFKKQVLGPDLEKLKGLYASTDSSVQKTSSRVCEVIRKQVWGEDVEKQLRNLNVDFSNVLVAGVLESLETEPNKALIFFRWIEESGLFKHDERTYNAMLTVLGREDSMEKFWKMVDEMRHAGCGMEKGTYIKLLGRFVDEKMMNDAVDLYEFAMGGIDKPSVQDCTYLLKKIAVGHELDMDLFSKVVRINKEGGNVLTNKNLNSVFKSLASVGRIGECNKILKAMEEGGAFPSGALLSKIGFYLSNHGEYDKAREFLRTVDNSEYDPNHKTWVSLIEGYCVAKEFDKAFDCFQKMVDEVGISCVGHSLELLVNACHSKKKTIDVFKMLCNLVTEKELRPWLTTYKVLISKLLGMRSFNEALYLLSLMKNQGHSSFEDPFIKYVSNKGTVDDALMFLKATTIKRFPSTSVFISLFKAYFKAGRSNEAHDLLSKCPKHIRNHADILYLFYSLRSGAAPASCPAVAS